MKTWDLMHLERSMPDDFLLLVGRDMAVAVHIPTKEIFALPGFSELSDMVTWIKEVSHAVESLTASTVLREVPEREKPGDVQALS
jgi:hypothetical protein